MPKDLACCKKKKKKGKEKEEKEGPCSLRRRRAGENQDGKELKVTPGRKMGRIPTKNINSSENSGFQGVIQGPLEVPMTL